MNRKFFKRHFIKKATEQGCVREAVCIYKNISFWSEMLYSVSWIKTYKLEVMYSYVVNEKPYFKYLTFRVSKGDKPNTPYKIRIYYCKKHPSYSCWEPTDIV